MTKKAFPGGPRTGAWQTTASKPPAVRKLFDDDNGNGLTEMEDMDQMADNVPDTERVETDFELGRTEGGEQQTVVNSIGVVSESVAAQTVEVHVEPLRNPLQQNPSGRRVLISPLFTCF
ncbi:hypothetical protein M5689_019485 [Euphorbia peplus]|nr:hypothetical protein M5689_019485 [Euphorbia peplus]